MKTQHKIWEIVALSALSFGSGCRSEYLSKELNGTAPASAARLDAKEEKTAPVKIVDSASVSTVERRALARLEKLEQHLERIEREIRRRAKPDRFYGGRPKIPRTAVSEPLERLSQEIERDIRQKTKKITFPL